MRRCLSVLAMGLAAAATVAAQDPLSVSPKNYKIEINNQWVRVLRFRQGPHESTPMYEQPATVVVYLTDSHQEFTGSDGRVQEITHKSGEVSYADAAKQSEENLSSNPL